MPQLRSYAEVTSLQATDAFMLDRLGTGTEWAPMALLMQTNPGLAVEIITSNNYPLIATNSYGVKTSLGAFTVNLPQLSSIAVGAGILVFDADYNAAANNITVAAFGGDLIADHAATSGDYIIETGNTITALYAIPMVSPYTVAGQWRAFTYSR